MDKTIIVSVKTDAAGSEVEDEFALSEQAIAGMNSEELEDYIEEAAHEIAMNLIEWEWRFK